MCYNRYLIILNFPIFFKDWFENIQDPHVLPMTFLEIKQKYKVQCNFLECRKQKTIMSIRPEFQLPDKISTVDYLSIPTSLEPLIRSKKKKRSVHTVYIILTKNEVTPTGKQK